MCTLTAFNICCSASNFHTRCSLCVPEPPGIGTNKIFCNTESDECVGVLHLDKSRSCLTNCLDGSSSIRKMVRLANAFVHARRCAIQSNQVVPRDLLVVLDISPKHCQSQLPCSSKDCLEGVSSVSNDTGCSSRGRVLSLRGPAFAQLCTELSLLHLPRWLMSFVGCAPISTSLVALPSWKWCSVNCTSACSRSDSVAPLEQLTKKIQPDGGVAIKKIQDFRRSVCAKLVYSSIFDRVQDQSPITRQT